MSGGYAHFTIKKPLNCPDPHAVEGYSYGVSTGDVPGRDGPEPATADSTTGGNDGPAITDGMEAADNNGLYDNRISIEPYGTESRRSA